VHQNRTSLYQFFEDDPEGFCQQRRKKWNNSTEERINIGNILSTYQEKIPARNAIYAHAQDFSAGDEFATSHPESIYSTTTEQTTDNRFSCVLMNSM
jgi:hypothetical protein